MTLDTAGASHGPGALLFIVLAVASIAICRCSGQIQPLLVEKVLRIDGPDVGQYTNVKLGSDDRPFVAYYDERTKKLARGNIHHG